MNTAFDRMTTDEQIRHVQDLWDRISERPENVVVSEAWRVELARRGLGLEMSDQVDAAMRRAAETPSRGGRGPPTPRRN